MKSLVTRLAATALLLAVAVPFPGGASAYSFHTPAQSQSVDSDTWNVTVVYDPFGFELYNTQWIFGAYDYTFVHPFSDTVYSHWVYDYLAGRWVFRFSTHASNFN